MPTLQTYQGVYLWRYVPSLPLSVMFLGLFTIVTSFHCWRLYKTKALFTIPFIVGGICEIFGYVTRAAASSNTGSLILYLLPSILLVVPPIGFAATLYIVYARIVRAVHAEDLSPIPIRWVSWIFITGDFTCLMIQGNAAGLLGNEDLTLIADYIIIAGLILQIIVFTFFIVCCGIFNKRMRAYVAESCPVIHLPWQSCINMLYMTSTTVLVRNIYRVVEFVMQSVNKDGYLVITEWPLYVFDASLMFLLMVAFYLWYPHGLHRGGRDSSIHD
ncbi:RTA1 like protein-domain-containing protein [Penicillium pulvis]|uniref:RTA1 like protein-domain-containing protein n=1 Tax=Penicillium pulvis TaxID=1562058 RepID=UPI0025468507|nr:RTA1 like protein-domain-containing protein [Penicillium pulvis]KAJ5813577.1 RTA1 like protein-domain-containing protein [Penicillium pulvis]